MTLQEFVDAINKEQSEREAASQSLQAARDELQAARDTVAQRQTVVDATLTNYNQENSEYITALQNLIGFLQEKITEAGG